MPVYLVQVGETGPVKVGWAVDVQKRLASLQCGCPQPLRVLRVIDGAASDERRLHKKLAKHRIRGEWFEPAAEVLAAHDFGSDATHTIGASPIHPITRYCRRHGLRLCHLAKRLGCAPPALSRLVNDARRPSSDMLTAIYTETGGEISVYDLIDWHWPGWREPNEPGRVSRGDGLAEEVGA